MDEDYQSIASKLGTPRTQQPFDPDNLAYMRDRLPPRLSEFLAQTGHSVFGNAVTLCPSRQFAPVLAMIFKADKDLDHRDCTLVSYTGFGELGIWSDRHGVVFVDLAAGEVRCRSLAGASFTPKISLPKPVGKPNDPNRIARGTIFYRSDSMDYFDWQGQNMLTETLRVLGALELGECYGFFPALGLAGTESRARSVENLRRVQAFEHFTMLAQLQPFYLTSIASGRIEKVREIG